MKLTPVLAALTAVNLALGVFNLVDARPSKAEGTPGVIRGTGLQIVDGKGKVRASISVFPEDKTTRYPDGRVGYPETVLLRLIDEAGRPSVKISANDFGGGVMVGAPHGNAYAQLGPLDGGEPKLTLATADGRKKVVEP
jgi:hypothetical protein